MPHLLVGAEVARAVVVDNGVIANRGIPTEILMCEWVVVKRVVGAIGAPTALSVGKMPMKCPLSQMPQPEY